MDQNDFNTLDLHI